MTLPTLALLLHASIAATGAEPYAEAHREAQNGKPMLVLVSTDWCPPCQAMKKTVLPQIRKRGLLRNIAFAIVNPDHDGKLAQKLTGSGSRAVPQLIMFRKTPQGWKRWKLIGGQSVGAVERFIRSAVKP